MPKRLCVFSDGTWSNPEKEIPTNIFRMATCLSPMHGDMAQLVFYDSGIGTDGSMLSRLRGGAFGEGIDQNIQQLYTFLAMNYTQGDEILLFGYSRGAYTVRSLAGMINEAGLVYRHELDFVKEAYDLYRDNKDIESAVAKEFRKQHSRRVGIKLLACFDTVGSLGIPFDPPFGLGFLFNADRYKFHDTKIGAMVEHAVHLVSLDEDRKSFQPTLMHGPPERLTQLFLPGHHGGIGGEDSVERGLGDNALVVMLEEIQKRMDLGFEKGMLPSEGKLDELGSSGKAFDYGVMRAVTGRFSRVVEDVKELHESVYRRYRMVESWRPEPLEKFKRELEAFAMND